MVGVVEVVVLEPEGGIGDVVSIEKGIEGFGARLLC